MLTVRRGEPMCSPFFATYGRNYIRTLCVRLGQTHRSAPTNTPFVSLYASIGSALWATYGRNTIVAVGDPDADPLEASGKSIRHFCRGDPMWSPFLRP